MTPETATHLKSILPQHDAEPGGTYRLPGKKLALQTGYVTKSIDRGRMTVDAVLTYPGEDYDGDTVNPTGGDWRSEFPANPVVNWTHAEPIARGDVPTLKTFGDAGQLPVGRSHFFQGEKDTRGLRLFGRDATGRPVIEYSARDCVDAAHSAFRLVADDIASGVSIEFQPAGPQGKAFWPTGKKSLLLGRDAMHWERWVGMGWAHALQCKNPNARTILPADEDRLAKAFRIAETGKFPGGEAVSPLILKSFLPLRDRKPKYVRVETKAMDPTAAPDGVELPPEADAAPEPDKGMKPTPTAYMQAIQHLQDGKQAIQDLLDNGTLEHEKGIAGLEDHLEELQALCDDLNAKAAKMFPDAGFEGAKAEPDAEPKVETNDDGAVTNKAFPSGFPVRFRVAKGGGYELVKPQADPEPPVEQKAIDAEFAAEMEENETLRGAARRAIRLAQKNGMPVA